MTSGRGRDPKALDKLRVEARALVARTSLPKVAHELEMAPDTLRGFFDGGSLPPRAQSRLSRWIHTTRRLVDERAQRCVGMLQEVVADLPVHRQMKGITAVLHALRKEFNIGAGPVPIWLSILIEAVEHAGSARDPEQIAEVLNAKLTGNLNRGDAPSTDGDSPPTLSTSNIQRE